MSSFGAKQVFSKAHIDYCKSQETPANVKMNGLYCRAAKEFFDAFDVTKEKDPSMNIQKRIQLIQSSLYLFDKYTRMVTDKTLLMIKTNFCMMKSISIVFKDLVHDGKSLLNIIHFRHFSTPFFRELFFINKMA